MISFNSFNTFCVINSFLLSLGFFQYVSISYCDDWEFGNYLLAIFFIFISRNYILLFFINFATENKPKINNSLELPLEDYKYEFHTNVVTATSVETITHLFIKTNIINVDFSRDICYEVIYFIPISFLFEIIFDFFHYVTHRLLHHKYLYKFLHKKHHKFKHPTSITTFYQEPIDLMITNSIPTILTVSIIPRFSYFMFHFITVYKNYTEICGHCGTTSYPTSSFPQFIWLPKWFNIELYTEDHNFHHSANNCNYSKRFTLWDKVFKTYKYSG